MMAPMLLITTHILAITSLHPLMHTSESLSDYKPDITRRVFDMEGANLLADSTNATDTGNGAAASSTVEGEMAGEISVGGEKKSGANSGEHEETVAERKQRLKMKCQFSDVMAESTARALKELGPCPCDSRQTYMHRRDPLHI